MPSGTNQRSGSLATLYLLAWVPAALLAFHLKYALLDANGGGFEFVAQLEGLRSTAELSFWQRIALFREDVYIIAVLVPLFLLFALRYLKPVQRRLLIGAVSGVTTAVLFVELKCFWEVGTFLPLSVLWAGVTDTGREYLGDYLPIDSIAKLTILLLAANVLAWGATRLERRALQRQVPGQVGRVFRGAAMTLVVCAAAVLWIPRLPTNPYESSAALTAIRAFASRGQEDAFQREYASAEPAALRAAYSSLTHASVPNARSRFWARAANYDVIFFVLETAPSQCLDLDAAAELFPNLRKLRAESFVASEHYSTYPYTVRAVFSIYSSWYPSNTRTDAVKLLDRDHPELLAPGVARSTRAAGYHTAIFVPDAVDNWEHDQRRYATLGFSEQVFPRNPDRRVATPVGTEDPVFRWREYKDRATLALLKDSLLARIRSHERYLYAFHPQYSHGPWPNVGANSGIDATCAAGAALFHVEDRWIGEVLDLLAHEGRLNKTIIVVTGDHGIRTRTEHPSFVGGTLDAISYHVPLLIYAPEVLRSPVAIGWLTSHIDIAPSVLDLLGISAERELEQGSPIWEPRLQDRMTFFFGRNYLGPDGFYYRGRGVMLKYLFGGVSATRWTGRLAFAPSDLVRGDPAFAKEATQQMLRFNSLQTNWVNLMTPANFAKAVASKSP